ncbi:hypothetical protein WEI85_00625 [Actinomycetes bacterium KLBMP 9797]
MTATPAPTSSPALSALVARLRSMVSRTSRLDGVRLLQIAAVTVAAAVAVLAMVNAATSLYTFAARHGSSWHSAVMLTAAVLGLYTAVTASAWRARLRGGRLSRLSWLLWWAAVGVGLAATAAAAGSDTWVARGINAVPMAALAAVTALVTRPSRP